MIYYTVWYHPQTNAYLKVGFTCTDKMDIGDEDLFRMKNYRNGCKDFMRNKAGKMKAEQLLKDMDLEVAWEIYQNIDDYQNDDKRFICGKIYECVSYLIHYGSYSEAHETFFRKMVQEFVDFEKNLLKKQEEYDNAENCPSGKVKITGEILCFKNQESFYGYTLKMLVQDEKGYKVWGTVPKSLDEARKGDIVEFNATLEPSNDDPKFGFFKRPSKAKVKEEANVR